MYEINNIIIIIIMANNCHALHDYYALCKGQGPDCVPFHAQRSGTENILYRTLYM